MERAKSVVKTSADAPNPEVADVGKREASPSDSPTSPLERSRSVRQASKINPVVATEQQESPDNQSNAGSDNLPQASTSTSISGTVEGPKPPSPKAEGSGDQKSPNSATKKSIVVPAESTTTGNGISATKDTEGKAIMEGNPPAEAEPAPKSKSPDLPADASKKPSVFVSAITREMRLSMTPMQLATALVAEEEDFKLKEAERNAPRNEEKPPTPPPPPEVRALPYIPRPNPKILDKIEREMSTERYYLMGKRVHGNPEDPESCSFFVRGDIGQQYEVKIRQFPGCQCGDYLEMRLCKHIMFVMLKFFKLKKGDHRIWQRALLTSELQPLLIDPRITPSSQKLIIKTKFTSKLSPPKASSAKQPSVPAGTADAQDDCALGPQYCPICLEQFNFVAETPEIPYLGPIPWKPKFVPKLDMAPPASIRKMRKEKRRLENAIKKHQEVLRKGSGEGAHSEISPSDGEKDEEEGIKSDAGKKAVDNSKLERNGDPDQSDTNTKSQSAGQKRPEEPEPLLRKYETILFCSDPECRGKDECFKIVHEWCYRRLDNYGLYPRGKAAPTYCLM